LVPGDRIEARYGQINAFERHLGENDVTILKFYLHISKKEQKARLQARLDDPTKRWKFNPDDLAERKHWHDYIAAYRIALERCSTEWAPGSSFRRTGNGTATPSSRASSGARSKRWI
jgi:polyphosphate kinase 2 (PPK2 family)